MPTPREMMEAAERSKRDESRRSRYASADGAGYPSRQPDAYGQPAAEPARTRNAGASASAGEYGRGARRDSAASRDAAGSSRGTARSTRSDGRSAARSGDSSRGTARTTRDGGRSTARSTRDDGRGTARSSRSGAAQDNRDATRSTRRASHAAPSDAARPTRSNATQDTTRPSNGASAGHAREVPHRPQSKRMRDYVTRWRMYGVAAFAAIMVIGGFTGLLFFFRPITSAVEMRNLTQFPEFTAERFLNGSYFTDLSLWYADTYPLREPMVAADHAIDSLFGINTGSGMVGGNVKTDEIPVEESEPDFSPVVPPAEAPNERAVAADIQENIMSGVYVTNGAGYSIYYFSKNAADTYITAMNTAAEKLYGTSTVYSIMAPANSITLSDEEALSVGGSDQQQALDYLSTRYDTRVKAVDLVSIIKEHRDEYLYFHTDHHWTQLGAYYGYVAFCEQKGIEPKSLDDWTYLDLGEFQGTYSDTVQSMGYMPTDEVEAYVPASTNDMTYWTSYGDEIDGKVVNEEAVSWEPSYKYSAFIAGDQPLSIIHNPKLEDGSSCLVVKDSYGCAFVPCLVDNYETIHVIDFRETSENICDYAIENEIQDVIFMTGIKIGLTDSVAQTLLSEVS